jgi:hypothetical protein
MPLLKTNNGLSYYDNTTQTTPYNYVYTVPIQIGTPGQTAGLIVDINVPTTIIFSTTTTSYNGTTYTTSNQYPNYVNTFYSAAASSTYVVFKTGSSISNVASCGYLVNGYLSNDNFCLNTELSK